MSILKLLNTRLKNTKTKVRSSKDGGQRCLKFKKRQSPSGITELAIISESNNHLENSSEISTQTVQKFRGIKTIKANHGNQAQVQQIPLEIKYQT